MNEWIIRTRRGANSCSANCRRQAAAPFGRGWPSGTKSKAAGRETACPLARRTLTASLSSTSISPAHRARSRRSGRTSRASKRDRRRARVATIATASRPIPTCQTSITACRLCLCVAAISGRSARSLPRPTERPARSGSLASTTISPIGPRRPVDAPGRRGVVQRKVPLFFLSAPTGGSARDVGCARRDRHRRCTGDWHVERAAVEPHRAPRVAGARAAQGPVRGLHGHEVTRVVEAHAAMACAAVGRSPTGSPQGSVRRRRRAHRCGGRRRDGSGEHAVRRGQMTPARAGNRGAGRGIRGLLRGAASLRRAAGTAITRGVAMRARYPLLDHRGASDPQKQPRRGGDPQNDDGTALHGWTLPPQGDLRHHAQPHLPRTALSFRQRTAERLRAGMVPMRVPLH